MEKLAEFQPILLIVFSIIIIGLVIYIMIMNRQLVSNIIKNKVTIMDLFEVNVESGDKNLSIVFTNQSMNDATLTGLGIVYKNKSFDFREAFLKQFEVMGDQIVLSPRSSYKLVLAIDEVEKPLFANVDGKSLSKVKLFATTNAGAIFFGKAKRITKVLKSDYKALVKNTKRQGRIDFASEMKAKKEAGEKLPFKVKLKLFAYKTFFKIK